MGIIASESGGEAGNTYPAHPHSKPTCALRPQNKVPILPYPAPTPGIPFLSALFCLYRTIVRCAWSSILQLLDWMV